MGSTQSPRYRRFLARLRQARLDADMTQREVAKRMRQPQSFVSRCETGERRVDAVELEDFAKLYGKGVTCFLPEFPGG